MTKLTCWRVKSAPFVPDTFSDPLVEVVGYLLLATPAGSVSSGDRTVT